MFTKLSEAISTDLRGCTTPPAIRMLERHGKKFSCSSNDSTRLVAITQFKSDCKRVQSFNISLSAEEISEAKLFIEKTLQLGTQHICERYGIETYPQQILPMAIFGHEDFLSFGKGASSDAVGLTHILDKLSKDKVSYTERSLFFVRYLKGYHAETFELLLSNLKAKRYQCVQGSRLTTVPKNSETDRVIACEPTINMWFQLAFGRFLQQSLKSIGLDITNQQTINQAYARSGSLFCQQFKDPFCTIDLKSASDSISMELLRLLFPPCIVQIIEMLRSPNISVDGELIELPMVSTMGNGFTFPLLTLVCSALFYTANKRLRGGHINWRHTAVFGDDIIVRRSVYHSTVDLLERAGFLVNLSKSYSVGLFRESCGGDYYDGRFITPAYITYLDSDEDVRVALNILYEWSSRHFYLEEAIKYLLSLLKNKPNLVPLCFSYDSGILYPVHYGPSKVSFYQRTVKPKFFKEPRGFKTWAYLSGFLTSTRDPKSLKEAIIIDSSETDGKDFDCYISRECQSRYVLRGFRYPFPWDTLKETRESDWWDRPKYVPIGRVLTKSEKIRWAFLVDLSFFG